MKNKLILLGASTGGPGHLKKIFSQVGVDFCTPTIIAQHMNPVFIQSFVKQFDDELPLKFLIANSKHNIENYTVHICATHCGLHEREYRLKLESTKDVISHYNPSVDFLFKSALNLSDKYDILAILLTGIGQDGAEGLCQLQKNGVTCIAENEESAIVYGMPKRALELNNDIKTMNLDSIIKYIKKFDRE